MENSVKIFVTIEELAQYFASFLAMQIGETSGDRHFSWVLSGGKTPERMFREIASNFRNNTIWNKVKVFWCDERCVGPNDRESNYRMANEILLKHIPIPTVNIFRIQGEADPVAEAGRYSELFSRFVNPYNGIPQCDLMMLGLGEDGHTASIFPANMHLFNSDKLFEPTEHPYTKQNRITATGKTINHAKTVVIIATGKSKASRVAQIINQRSGWDRLPASLVRPENGNLLWLLDHQAAFNIK